MTALHNPIARRPARKCALMRERLGGDGPRVTPMPEGPSIVTEATDARPGAEHPRRVPRRLADDVPARFLHRTVLGRTLPACTAIASTSAARGCSWWRATPRAGSRNTPRVPRAAGRSRSHLTSWRLSNATSTGLTGTPWFHHRESRSTRSSTSSATRASRPPSATRPSTTAFGAVRARPSPHPLRTCRGPAGAFGRPRARGTRDWWSAGPHGSRRRRCGLPPAR